MKLYTKFIAMLAVSSLLFSIGAEAAATEIPDWGISNYQVTDGYFICSDQSCDTGFTNLLKFNNMTFDQWKQEVMEPNHFYLYACDNNQNCQYVRCEKLTEDEIKNTKDGMKSDRLSKDYNMLEGNAAKEGVLNDLQKGYSADGVTPEKVTQMKWFNTEKGAVTPYVEMSYYSESTFVIVFQTIYNGVRINYQYTSLSPFSQDAVASFENAVKEVKYKEAPDYTKAKKIAKENAQKEKKKNAPKNDSNKMALYTVLVIVGVIILIVIGVLLFKRRRYYD